jgi:nicotinamidase-related amidase
MTLFVVDFQERLFAAMPEGERDRARRNASNLVWLAGELGWAVLASEQYPQGLGPTLADLGVGGATPKTAFSALREPGFPVTEGEEIVLFGMETHICVAQTVADLRVAGKRVRVVADACLSRRKLDWKLGLAAMERVGADIVTAEAVLFAAVARAGTPLFKELSRRIR